MSKAEVLKLRPRAVCHAFYIGSGMRVPSGFNVTDRGHYIASGYTAREAWEESLWHIQQGIAITPV